MIFKIVTHLVFLKLQVFYNTTVFSVLSVSGWPTDTKFLFLMNNCKLIIFTNTVVTEVIGL